MNRKTITFIIFLAVIALFVVDVACTLVVDGKRIGEPNPGPRGVEMMDESVVSFVDRIDEEEEEEEMDETKEEERFLKSKNIGGLQMAISQPTTPQFNKNPSVPSTSDSTTIWTASSSSTTTASTLTFQTFLAGNNRSWGNMFDIEAKKSLTITRLNIHTSSTLYVHFEIWTKSGTHEGFESDKDSWTLWAKGYTIGMGDGVLTPLPISVFGYGLLIEKGERRAFYVQLTEPFLKYDNGKFNSMNSDLIVHYGKAVARVPFGKFFQPRIWNGSVEYILDPSQEPDSDEQVEQELFVTLEGRTGSYGIQFDIHAKQDIMIHKFSIHILEGKFDLAIYTKEDSHVGYEDSFDGWTNIFPLTQMQGRGQMHLTPLPDDSMDSVYIPAGTTQAFFISSTNANLRYSKAQSAVGSTFIDNDDISITVGTGIGGFPHGRLFSPRVFNGVVHYKVPDQPPDHTGKSPTATPKASLELETTMKGGTGSFGNMFSVVASSKKVTIKGMKLHVVDGHQGLIAEIYTKQGSFEGFENDISSWNRVFFGFIETKGLGRLTPLPSSSVFVPVPIEAGATQSFYVTLNKAALRYSRGNSFGASFASNEDLRVLEGIGMSNYPFKGKLFSPRLFNGVILYETSDTEAPNFNSNQGMSPFTTPYPTYHPTAYPTDQPTAKPTFDDFELATDFKGDNGNFGNMIDVYAKTNVSIKTLSIHTSATKKVGIVVFAKEGSFRGSETSKSKWNKIFESEVLGNGFLKRTVLPSEEFTTINLCAGKTYSLYITLLERQMRYTNFVAERDKNIENDHFEIDREGSVGVGTYPFGPVYKDRMWDGVLHYTLRPDSFVSPSSARLAINNGIIPRSSLALGYPKYDPLKNAWLVCPSKLPSSENMQPRFSKAPSQTLSEAPSMTPSQTLSVTPSEAPSVSPSLFPSSDPSSSPSEIPSPEIFDELATDFRGDKVSNGVMFNLKSTRGIWIKTLALHIKGSAKEEYVEVFVRKGRYQRYKYSSDGWQQVFGSNVKGMGYMVTTILPHDFFTPIKICPNELIGIYISLKEKHLFHSDIPVDVSNQDLILDLSVGSAVSGYGFDEGNTFYKGRTWNGIIYYDNDAQCSPTVSPSPTLLPSIVPSDHPTAAPIFEPSVQPTSTASLLPSTYPSKYPSHTPTLQPSILPSYTPSIKPSTEPTLTHSTIPSSLPSNPPSSNPTWTPTNFPSAIPTKPPSISPTAIPTSTPSLSHSSLPSFTPTSTPTSVPTLVASNEPTETHSSTPSISKESIKLAVASSISIDVDLADPDSPQSKALEWLLKDKTIGKDEKYIAQRYTMGVLFHSLGGAESEIHPDWGSNKNHCSWEFIQCINGEVVEIQIDPLYSKKIKGILPYEIQEMENLEYLVIQNSQLSGTIPKEIGTLTYLKQVDLSGNKLSGPFNTEFGKLTDLEELSLYGNALTGEIPSEIGLLTNMIGHLKIHANKLQGSIPSELGQLTSLGDLMLQQNDLTGFLPSQITQLVDLKHLLLDGNNLVGSIHPDLGSISDLQYLSFKGNQMTGTIPTELGKLTDLRYIIFSSNSFSSTIPSELGNLKKLEKAYFFSNQLTGTMPPDICANRDNTIPPGNLLVLQVDCSMYCTCCTNCQ